MYIQMSIQYRPTQSDANIVAVMFGSKFRYIMSFLFLLTLAQKRKADQTDEIRIPHPGQTDGPTGDKFGALLETFNLFKKNHYYRHLFIQVEKNTAAYSMKLK